MATEDQNQQQQEEGAQQNDATQSQDTGAAVGGTSATGTASDSAGAADNTPPADTGTGADAAGAGAADAAGGDTSAAAGGASSDAAQAPSGDAAGGEPAQAPTAPATPTPAPAPAPAPVVKPAPTPAPKVVSETRDATKVQVVIERNVADAINAAAPGNSPVPFYETPGLSTNGRGWLRRLNEYMQAMRAGLPVEVDEGKAWQKVLYRTLMNVIHNSDDAEFSVLFKIILDQFVVHKDGVFHPGHSMRFAEHIELNEAERATFFNLVDLLTIAADAKGRELRLRQVDLNKSLTSEFTEQGKQRIRAFLGKK